LGGLVFGPVYSRRLGASLGVNNIPYKVCSYSCVYCQLGRTLRLSVERRPYSDPARVAAEVARALEGAGRVDYVTFVPDGEPTLDSNLGAGIRLLRGELGVRVAVLTNASLLWRGDVRGDLYSADTVSVKVDAARERVWRRVNRPHPALRLEEVIGGLRLFSREYPGTLLTETMLVRGLNDDPEELAGIADLIATLNPAKAYIAIPTRPPAEDWVHGAGHEALTILHEELKARGVEAELLTTDEPPPPTPKDPIAFIEATTLVHPLRLDYAEKLLKEKGYDPQTIINKLTANPQYKIVQYRGHKYIARRPAKP
jgi:wyosine [tRNA(Phe)-imidazoG37] synthetase (radical SAM superfamily)